MTYWKWNEHIAQFFFKPDNAGKNIIFYLSKQDLIKYSREHFSGLSDEQIWDDFVLAIKYNTDENKKRGFSYSPIDRPIELFKSWNKTDVPPFIAYLIIYIIPLTESYEEHFNASNFYGKVNVFFKKHGILTENTQDAIGTINFQNISHLWNEMEEWAVMTMNCDLGIFELKLFGNLKWKHVGKPFSHCVLPPRAINRLPELFYEAGLIPDSVYSRDELRKVLLRNGVKVLGLKESVIELIKNKSASNELGQSIIGIVRREYNKWTGETFQNDEVESLYQIRRNYTVAPLFLQFRMSEILGNISFSYRIYSSNEYPEDLKLDNHENLYEANGWSKTLNIPFQEQFEIKDDFNKWIARFPQRDVRLFISAATYQLSTGYWIETESLSRTDPMYLLCVNNKKESIIEWSKTFKKENFKEVNLDGLPENYSLFRIFNPTKSHSEIDLLTLYTEKKVELVNGLKINFRTFINHYIPEVEILNSEGNEKVFLQYKDSAEKVLLKPKKSSLNHWVLPSKLKLNTDFYVKVEGAVLDRYDSANNPYTIVSSDDSTIKVDGVQLPKRDSFGRITQNMSGQFCRGCNIINATRASQKYYSPWGNLFLSINEELEGNLTAPEFDNHVGNLFSSYLTLKNLLTTEEFYKAFEFYYSKEFKEHQTNPGFNLTRIKKSSLNFLDYLGFLDFDYETKKIVINPAQFIFIPSNQGRRMLLIGGRDSSLVRLLLNTAIKHGLRVIIEKQFSLNEKLLLPDAIIIQAFGKRTDGFGEKNLISFAQEVNIPFNSNVFTQLALKLFSASIEEYETDLLQTKQTSEEDFGWARRVFNPTSLNYERNESTTFDKSFSLIEYKLNEYTYYNKLWNDGKCYSVDKNWGRYLALKHAKKHIILFDNKNNRVAIPWETPLPRLLSQSILFLSGLAPEFKEIEGRNYRIYENIPGIFAENLFNKLGQKPHSKNLI